jgi:hypothetical protein
LNATAVAVCDRRKQRGNNEISAISNCKFDFALCTIERRVKRLCKLSARSHNKQRAHCTQRTPS